MTTIAEVKERLDIADVVSRYVPLQRAGRNLRALCPFHQERTPSFYVFPETKTWRCFGACATGGDVISFVQRREDLDFTGALHLLAEQAGVALPQRATPSHHERLYAANQEAAQFYHQRLLSPEGEEAHRYLEGRGLSQEIIETFLLGYSPSDPRALTRHLTELGYTEEELTTAGLLRGEAGGRYDQFRNRVIYPIRDQQGRGIGFGARELDGATPKYLNTPRTPIFDKGATLYGLDRATEAIRRLGVGVIVEGYMDVIAAHQHGFTNVVASMGTALTQGQLASLQRFSATFVLALDPDTAGQAATLQRLEEATSSFQEARGTAAVRSARGGHIFTTPVQHFSLQVAHLPEGRDPDQVIRQDPPEWERLVGQALPLLDYLLEVMAARYDMTTPEGKAQAAERLVPLVYSHVTNFVEQDQYFQRLADLLGVSRQVLQASVGGLGVQRPRRSSQAQRQATVSPFAQTQGDPVEEYCLSLLLQYPELRHVAQDMSPDDFRRGENREVFTQWMRYGTIEEAEKVLASLLAEYLASLLSRDLPPLDTQERERALRGVFRRLQERRLKEAKLQESQVLGEQEEATDEELEEQALRTNEALRALFLQQRRI